MPILAGSAAVAGRLALSLGPIALSVIDNGGKAPQELKESVAKIAQAQEELRQFARRGFTHLQVQPLVISVERLAQKVREVNDSRLQYEQGRLGPAAAMWAIGVYASDMDELQQAVNTELQVIHLAQPCGKPLKMPAPFAAPSQKGEPRGNNLQPPPGADRPTAMVGNPGAAAGKHMSTPAHVPIAAKSCKIGDHVEVWSTSLHVWSHGHVKNVQGNLLEVEYASASGEMRTKQLPSDHEHVRITGARQPPSAQDSYKVGESIEIWSNSQQTWCLGHVKHVQGHVVDLEYATSDGGIWAKQVPVGHGIRRPQLHHNATALVGKS
jgi:hypothetical protein